MAVQTALLLGGLGFNLASKIFATGSERARRRKLRERLLAENMPLEALLRTRQFGPSESEGALMNTVVQRTLGDLASRGVLNSSISAPAVAGAVAPIENERQARTQGLMERVVAARQAILQGTELPGYGQAFGESFGEAGDLLALFSTINQRGGGMDDYVSSEGLGPQAPPQYDSFGDRVDSNEFGRRLRRGSSGYAR